MIKVDRTKARGYTRAVLAAMENGAISNEDLVRELLNYMSEADVADFVERNLYEVIECDTEEEDDE